jgi:ferric-dicitrate binding protein FerR (iron transport regulator)
MSEPSPLPPDALAFLIRLGGHREVPPRSAYDRAWAATTEAWRAKVRARRMRRISALAAGLAIVTVAALLALHSMTPPPAAATIAQVERVIGAVQVRSTMAGPWISLKESAAPLREGTVLRTGAASAASLRIRDVSVRLADNVEVELQSEARLWLKKGKVYVDTGGQVASRGMLVVTEAATVTDIGTQFEVQFRDGDCRVRVREGAVLLQRGELRKRGIAGEQINIDARGTVTSSAVAPNDPEWHWIHALASAPDIDEQPLSVLLDWVARESGVKVRYATPAVERKANATILHGSIQRLDPFQALEVMLATTDLRHEVLSDGTILIK